ncbi:MAG: S41 family peptidase [Rhodothermia bacterium]|nr:S41 family peptidase [Rhodothermia bacterium]
MSRSVLYLGISAVFLTGILAGLLLARSGVGGGLTGTAPTDKIDRVIGLIERAYIDPPDEEKLVDSAIRGMTELLDPYSIYVDQRHLPSIREEINGSFGGVGLWFEMVGDTARVVSVVADGPGDRAGILPGDRIILIDDSAAVGLPSLVVQDRIKGPKGTDVELTLLRPAINKEMTVVVEREIIPIHSVAGAFMLDDSTAYVRLARFTSGTIDEFRSAVSQLRDDEASRLILDLRDNPGGLLEAAIALADEFLPTGADIVSTEGRAQGDPEFFSASDRGVAQDMPLILLVNENSASASEIVAGAVQDNDRGLIVGRPTFGKGLVQSQFLFNDGSALHLTVARYHTPAGRPIMNDMSRSASGLPNPHSAAPTPADSLTEYTTVHGRTIKGGKGIYPDELLDPDALTDERYFMFVVQSGYGMNFVRKWFDANEADLRRRWNERKDEFVAGYSLPASLWSEFNDYVRGEAPEAFGQIPADERSRSRSKIMTMLKGRLGQLLYGPDVWLAIVSDVDPEIAAANRYWNKVRALPSR